MKNCSLFIGLCVLVISFGCQQSSAPEEQRSAEDSENVREIIEAKNAQVEDWYNAGLIDSVATVFADDVIQFAPNQPTLEGKEEFKAFWEQMAQNGRLAFDVNTLEVKQSGDLAVERGTFKFDFTPNEGSPIPAINESGDYVVVWERVDGNWKAVWDVPISKNEAPEQPADTASN